MKNYILLLLLATFGMQAQTLQNPTLGNLKLKNNQTSTTATKVNVQENDGTINTKPLSDLINVVEVNDVPSLPLIGDGGKIYVVKNINKIYRWNGTFYQELSVTNITYQSVIDALTFTPENVANKSDSYSVSSTATYPNTKALVDGLGTKISGTLTTNRIPKSFWTNSLGDSSINDNGTTVNTTLPIHANSFVKNIGSVNILLAGGADITQVSLPISTATQTALNLKANLSSPTLTGTPTAPTAAAGTNTTQIATTAFVTGANAGNVKLTGDQTINGKKTFSGQIVSRGILNTYSNTFPFTSSTSDDIISSNSSIGTGSAKIEFNAGGYTNGTYRIGVDGTDRVFKIGDNDNVYFKYQKSNGALTLESTGGVTAPKFIKSSTPATNILLAGGGDIAQNTAFNKPFGITAGTVVEGGTLGSNAYTSTDYLPLSGGTLTGALTVEDNIHVRGIGNTNIQFLQDGVAKWIFGYVPVISAYRFSNGITDVLTLYNDGSSKFSSTVTATSYSATSLPVFENNAAASSLAVGQFYRTSTGVLMVKF